MSANSFGCREHPFGPGYDSRFFYVRPGQEASFQELFARISAPDGLVLITGQAGSGKTTLLRELRTQLDAAEALTVFFPSPAATADTLLDACLQRLGLRDALGAGRAAKLEALADPSRHPEPSRPVAILADEGHALTDDVLNTFLALSAPVAEGRAPLAVVVGGEPVLEARLSEEIFQPLAGCIGYRYQLAALDRDDTAAFIDLRLRAAGCTQASPFSTEAVERLAFYADGLPARINQLADIALFIATLESTQQITGELVERAARDALLSEEPVNLARNAADEQGSAPQEPDDSEPGGPLLADVVGASGRMSAPPGTEAPPAAAFPPEVAFSQQDPTQTLASAWPGQESPLLDHDETEDLTLDDPDPRPTAAPTTADLGPLSALRQSPVGSADRTKPAPRRRRPHRSPGTRRAVVALLLVGSVVLAGWLLSTHQHRLHQLRPLLVTLDRAAALSSDRLQELLRTLREHASATLALVAGTAPENAPQKPLPPAAATASIDQRAAAAPDEPPVALRTPRPDAKAPDDQPAPGSTGYRLLTAAKVRERPSVSARLRVMLEKGSNVVVTGHVPGSNWYRIRTPRGIEGYMYAGLAPGPRTGVAAGAGRGAPVLGLLQFDEGEAAAAEIRELLARADEHFRADRLMAPRFDNALALYRKVLRAEPHNPVALAGIEKIKDKLMGFARTAVARGDLEGARSQVNKVLVIDAEDGAARAALADFGEAAPFSDFAGLEDPGPRQ
ncbi:MAG: AAA family ATPase [Gammaproteobacteria bacterium]|nr:AAA family ATPase [Gammaproteobacteria bacterium]